MLDRNRIKHSFHANAEQYDGLATVQRRVAERVAGLLREQCLSPSALLDVGCGTGTLLNLLGIQYPDARLIGLDLAFNMARQATAKVRSGTHLTNGDAELLPFRDCAFDLVVTTSTLQWMDTLDKSVAEMLRVVAPGGMVLIAYFGRETLWELRECYGQVLQQRGKHRHGPHQQRLHQFKDAGELKDALSAAGAETLLVRGEREVVRHRNVRELLAAIKNIGAGTAARRSAGGLGWRGILKDLDTEYSRRFRCAGSIPATYEVVYAIARRVS